MDKILNTDTMQQAAGKINAAFAELGNNLEVVGQADSMADVAGKCKRNFAALTDDEEITDITSAETMSEIADILEDNFAIAEDVTPPAPAKTLSFYHMSDPHGNGAYYQSTGEPVAMMKSLLNSQDNDCAFGIITGDIKPYTASIDSQYSHGQFDGWPTGKLLIINGNHDSCDSWESGKTRASYNMVNWMYGKLGNSVNWGDYENVVKMTDDNDNVYMNKSAYWYKDYPAGDRVVRVIALDQYEMEKVLDMPNGYVSSAGYGRAMTGTQLNWFINLLKATPSNYYIVIAMHVLPYNETDYGTEIHVPEPYDEPPATDRLLFVSEKYSDEGNVFNDYSTGDHNSTIPNIVKAYLAKSRYQGTYSNKTDAYATTKSEMLSISVDADFRDMIGEPAHFMCYLFGHIHGDICTFLPAAEWQQGENHDLFPHQLLLGITTARQGTNYSNADDQPASDVYHRINKVTLDLEDETVTVERIGQQNTTGGRTRDKIVFDINSSSVIYPVAEEE